MGRSQWRGKVKDPRARKGMTEQVERLGANGRAQEGGRPFHNNRRQETATDNNAS